MKIAISGLGKMGAQIAKILATDGHEVIGHDVNRETVDQVAAQGITPAHDEQAVVAAFRNEPVILWVMIPSQFVDAAIDTWSTVLPAGSIIIDGGNSDFRGDPRRAEKAAAHDIQLLDIGTSGGVWGIKNGFSMMAGGDETSFHTIEPILQTLAKPRGGYRYLGPSGAGHYVKMVHNAIEYGMMESLAEGYQMLREGPYENLNLADAGDVWQESSVITSFLNDLTRQALHENPDMDDIAGVVTESGEARWTLELAKKHGVPMPAVQAALDIRIASQNGQIDYHTKLLAAMRNKFGGHNINGKG